MLAVEDLHKSFGDIRALDSCSFTVSRGQMLGFLGPNGAGKTTAMRTVFGLLRPDSGVVTWDGEPITKAQRMRFGYMPEQRGLYPKMTATRQLTYLGILHGMEKPAAAAAAQDWLERFGLEARRDDPVEALSHGNQQRVQLAAALVHDPDLLVLDEPFSGLDPLAVETMSHVLRELAVAGKAVVFSSHQLDLVEDLCEEVAIINEGHVVVEGNVRALKDASPIRHIEVDVDVDGDLDGLLETLDDVRSHAVDGTVHTLTISSDTDIRGFLGRAEATGRLRHFAYTSPSLSELFRDAVG